MSSQPCDLQRLYRSRWQPHPPKQLCQPGGLGGQDPRISMCRTHRFTSFTSLCAVEASGAHWPGSTPPDGMSTSTIGGPPARGEREFRTALCQHFNAPSSRMAQDDCHCPTQLQGHACPVLASAEQDIFGVQHTWHPERLEMPRRSKLLRVIAPRKKGKKGRKKRDTRKC